MALVSEERDILVAEMGGDLTSREIMVKDGPDQGIRENGPNYREKGRIRKWRRKGGAQALNSRDPGISKPAAGAAQVKVWEGA